MGKTQLLTPWGAHLDKNDVLSEYPRPQFARASFYSLNGPWDFRIIGPNSESLRQGTILVPFAPESVLSGVGHQLQPAETLVYERTVALPEEFNRGVVYLHFGAVDQEADISIDGKTIGRHVGGFTPFSFDVTGVIGLKPFALKVAVKDYSDTHHHQTGKQKLHAEGIFYTAQSGIWQTVWLESVPTNHLKTVRVTPLWREKSFQIDCETAGEGDIEATISFQGKIEGHHCSKEKRLIISIAHIHPWSPEMPALYDIEIKFGQDVVKSYGAMRFFEKRRDSGGLMRFYLNEKPYLMLGVLDQGYWPDGLMTAPSAAAFVYDIGMMKKMGFNTIRKHIKIESLRFYYHCDRLGMLVMQDMINGGSPRSIVPNGVMAMMGIHVKDRHYRWFGREDGQSRVQYMTELKEMLTHLHSVPSIAVWTPFNEAWGQFDSCGVTKLIRHQDGTRLIDHASGWSDQGCGDFYSRHLYFTKIRFSRLMARKRVGALTEFGGHAFKVNGHMFDDEKAFGYKMMENEVALCKSLEKLWKRLAEQIKKGLSVIVYTQLSDVENEVNGLMTYDRAAVKVDCEKMRELNDGLRQTFAKVLNKVSS